MEALARGARAETRVYFTGGATAVLMRWRTTTIDVDVKLVPERDALLRTIPMLKEQLRMNVEFASPADFLPIPSGWQERSPFIRKIGRLSFFHFDMYAKALSKVERGHRQDVDDVQEMLARGLIERAIALEYFARMVPELYRFPAIDPASLGRAVEQTFRPAH